MLALKVINEDIKYFMSQLLVESTFDNFLFRDIKISSFTDFMITGIKNKEKILDEIPENTNDGNEIIEYLTWNDIKPYVFNIIKGKVKPNSMRIIFSPTKTLMEEISSEASAMFLNINFDKEFVQITTGSSQKIFSLNNTAQKSWEEYVINFLRENKIPYIE